MDGGGAKPQYPSHEFAAEPPSHLYSISHRETDIPPVDISPSDILPPPRLGHRGHSPPGTRRILLHVIPRIMLSVHIYAVRLPITAVHTFVLYSGATNLLPVNEFGIRVAVVKTETWGVDGVGGG